MDIETIKRTFGDSNRNYYVYCDQCPLDIRESCPSDCDGYEVAWSEIYKYINEEESPCTPTVEPTPNTEAVNHPAHYNRGKIEVADFIYDQQLNFNRGNAIKYICRAGFKGDMVGDLEKAIWYLNHELKMLKGCGDDE